MYIPEDGDDEYAGGVYITPLCKKCNSYAVDELVLREGCLLVAEIGAADEGE